MAIENIMNNKVKKVLSYIGVACLGAFIGMGALIGVSSCSKQDNDTQLKANKKSLAYKGVSYYQVREKSYYDGYYINTAISDYFTFDYDSGSSYGVWLECNGSISEGGVNTEIDQIGVFFQANQGEYLYHIHVNQITAYYQGTRVNYIYTSGGCTQYTLLLKDYSYVVPNKLTETYEGGLLDWLFIKLVPSEVFNFNKQINYNAPYGDNISTFAVYENDFNSGLAHVITYDMPLFLSGGFVFNQIKVFYVKAQGSYWFHSNGNVEVFSADTFAYYQEIQFINTLTNFSVRANLRNNQSHEINNGVAYVILNSSSWVSNDFQELTFLQEITPQQKLNISQFNNNIFGDSFAPANNSDIGLANVFDLLTLAFSSWVPILAIQVIPGISIGLLLFIPLISGIIILVIWMVKR